MEALLAARGDAAVQAIVEQIEESWDRAHLAETDKAWDAIHRSLTDGDLTFENGTYPLKLAVCGGQQLHQGEDYIVSLVRPEQVGDVAAALAQITDADMRSRYHALIPRAEYPEYGEDDCQYTVDYFGGLRDLFRDAAAAKRAVIFTVSQ